MAEDPKAQLDIQKQLKKLLEDNLSTVESIASSFKETTEVISNTAKEVTKLHKETQTFSEIEKQIQDLERDRLSTLEKNTIKAQISLDVEREQLKVFKQHQTDFISLVKLTESKDEKERKAAQLHLASQKIFKENLEDTKKKFQKQIDDQEKIVKNEIARNNALKLASENVDKIGSALGFASSINETWLGHLENTLKSSTSISTTLGAYGSKIFSADTASKLFESTVSKIAQSTVAVAFQMSEVEAEFNKASGTGGHFNDVINQTRLGSMQAGIGLQESAHATKALFDNMTSFTSLNTQTQAGLVKTTALLDQLGISGETTAKNLDISTKSLKMSTEEALNTQKEIAAEAIALGVAPSKLANDFSAAMPRLAAYGKQAVTIFKELEGQSKATGLSMDQLMNITGQFDTFEGAANAAGKLNAILGGNLLNSVDLLNASESERIEMLRRSVTESGQNFNSLDKYHQKAIAAAAGISDMTEAAKLFGTTDAEFQQVKAAQDAQALSTKELTEYASKSVSVHKQWDLVMQSLSGAAQPVLNVVSGLLNKILAFNDATGNFLLPLLVGVTGGLYLLGKAAQFVSASKQALTVTGNLLGISVEEEAAETTALTAAKEAETLAEVEKTAVAKEEAVAHGLTSAAIEEEAAMTEMKTASDELSIAATEEMIAAEEENTAVKGQGLLATIAQVTWEAIKKAAMFAGALAIGLYSAAEGIYVDIKEQGIVAIISDIATSTIANAVKWAGVIAQGALTVATWLGTAAVGAFGVAVAIATSPVTLIVLGIAALIAGVVLLVKNFSTISDWISNVTGGFLDLWDVISIAVGIVFPPLGILIQLVKAVANNWDLIMKKLEPVTSLVKDLAGWTWELTKSFISFLNPINVITGAWDLLTEGFDYFNGLLKDLTGGFVSIWDVILVLLGPVGLLIEAGKKLYENWDTVVSGIESIFTDLASFVSSIFNDIIGYISAPVNWVIGKINSVIGLANKLPGVNIGTIEPIGPSGGGKTSKVEGFAEGVTNLQGSYPESNFSLQETPALADGETNFTSGNMAMVGEKGPELVNLPTGSNVVSNENTSKLAASAGALQTVKAESTVKQTESIKNLTKTIQSPGPAGDRGGDNGERTIVLNVDGRELGRAVVNVFESKFKLNLIGA